MSKNKRIRPRLLILLWVWAILMFVVVDLFRDVPEFDHVRPDWQTYQQMRLAAHRMVGEPLEVATPTPHRQRTLRGELERADRIDSFEALVDIARDETADPRVRGRAMRRLSTGFEARDVLAPLAYDESRGAKVRSAAARYLARAGDVVGAARLADDPSRMVRQGARLGLAELGTAPAAQALLERQADAAVARIANPAAIPVLAEAAPRNAAACTALGNTKSADAVVPLVAVLRNKGTHPTIRAAAAEALGRLGRREALEAVTNACSDWHAPVVKEARLARQRLQYLTE